MDLFDRQRAPSMAADKGNALLSKTLPIVPSGVPAEHSPTRTRKRSKSGISPSKVAPQLAASVGSEPQLSASISGTLDPNDLSNLVECESPREVTRYGVPMSSDGSPSIDDGATTPRAATWYGVPLRDGSTDEVFHTRIARFISSPERSAKDFSPSFSASPEDSEQSKVANLQPQPAGHFTKLSNFVPAMRGGSEQPPPSLAEEGERFGMQRAASDHGLHSARAARRSVMDDDDPTFETLPSADPSLLYLRRNSLQEDFLQLGENPRRSANWEMHVDDGDSPRLQHSPGPSGSAPRHWDAPIAVRSDASIPMLGRRRTPPVEFPGRGEQGTIRLQPS